MDKIVVEVRAFAFFEIEIPSFDDIKEVNMPLWKSDELLENAVYEQKDTGSFLIGSIRVKP